MEALSYLKRQAQLYFYKDTQEGQQDGSADVKAFAPKCDNLSSMPRT